MEQEKKTETETEILARAASTFRIRWKPIGKIPALDFPELRDEMKQVDVQKEVDRVSEIVRTKDDPRFTAELDDHGTHWTAHLSLKGVDQEPIEVSLNPIAADEIDTRCIESVLSAVVKQAIMAVLGSAEKKDLPNGLFATRKILRIVEETLASCPHCAENVVMLDFVTRRSLRYVSFMVTDVADLNVFIEVPYEL